MAKLSYKFRLYPTEKQIHLLNGAFGCARFIHNRYLMSNMEQYQKTGRAYPFPVQENCLRRLIDEMPWLQNTDQTMLHMTFQRVFNQCKWYHQQKQSGKKAILPTKKQKKAAHQSYITVPASITEDTVVLHSVGTVKCRVHRPISGRVVNATVIRERSGKYFIAVYMERDAPEPMPKTGASVGVKLSVGNIAVTSDGRNVLTLPNQDKALVKLDRLQRKLDRQTAGSKNWFETRTKMARITEHMANQQQDAINKFTTDLVRQYDTIVIGNKPIPRVKTKPLDKNAAAMVMMQACRWQLKYKAELYGKHVVLIEQSAVSRAGIPQRSKMDRDIAMAKRILDAGLQFS